jgi:hypothetical protein
MPHVLVSDVDDFASVDAASRNKVQSREAQAADAIPAQSLTVYKIQ